MRNRSLWIAGIIVASVILVIVITLALTPSNTHPAFAAATAFMNAAGSGDDATAESYLSPELVAYVAANCPNGSVSACIASYTPSEWGNLIKAVFRRAIPDGNSAWDVDLIATYEFGTGFSGVCSYYRVEQESPDVWKVVAWAGFIHCGEDASRNMATNPDTPNRAP